jgi:hypothetical protein
VHSTGRLHLQRPLQVVDLRRVSRIRLACQRSVCRFGRNSPLRLPLTRSASADRSLLPTGHRAGTPLWDALAGNGRAILKCPCRGIEAGAGPSGTHAVPSRGRAIARRNAPDAWSTSDQGVAADVRANCGALREGGLESTRSSPSFATSARHRVTCCTSTRRRAAASRARANVTGDRRPATGDRRPARPARLGRRRGLGDAVERDRRPRARRHGEPLLTDNGERSGHTTSRLPPTGLASSTSSRKPADRRPTARPSASSNRHCEWAYGRTYQSLAQRKDALASWRHHCDCHRPHSGTGGLPPISRLTSSRTS